ncbi:LysR family transcriptional regulator [Streptomyces sp. NPDC002537]
MSLAHHVPDLSALELLLAVARTGSVGQAAQEMEITQPAASARIRSMERLVGVALIERSHRGSRLTEAGDAVANWARPVIEANEALEAGIGALKTRRDSRLRVAASLTVAEYLVPGWLITLRNQRPGIAVSLSVSNSSNVAQQILDGEADLGFVEGTKLPSGLDTVVVGEDRLLLVVTPNHPWARRRKPVPITEVAATSLIMREEGSGTRQVLVRALAEHGGPATPLLELASTAALRTTAISGAGPTVLSALAVREDLQTRRLVSVPIENVTLSRPLRAIWPAGHRPAGPARDLLALTRRTA